MAGELIPAIRRAVFPIWGPSSVSRVARRFAGRRFRRDGFPPLWREYSQEYAGHYRVEGAAGQYELYVGVDADPDFTAAPAQISASLPFSYAVTPPGAGTKQYRMCLRYRNEYGLLSQNQYTRKFTLDAAGDLVLPDPSAPEEVRLIEGSELDAVIIAEYYPDADGSNRADRWDIYVRSDGTDPVPGSDSPTVVNMTEVGHTERLAHALGPYSFGADVRVILRCRRNSDSADDGNTTVYQVILSTQLAKPTHADMPLGDVFVTPVE